MAVEVLVHLEHGHLVLAEDPPELVVGQDFAAVSPGSAGTAPGRHGTGSSMTHRWREVDSN
jgi:hypothetical protein